MDANVSLKQAESDFQKTFQHLKDEYGRLNIGRANAALVEEVKVEAYGGEQPLKAVASISLSDPRTLQIQPWDRNLLAAISKAIQVSDLHLNPTDDGRVIRIAFPALTEERRHDLVKVVHRLAEEARISIRHARQEAHNIFKKMQQDKTLSEDLFHLNMKHLQDEVDEMNGKIDEAAKAKEKEILTI